MVSLENLFRKRRTNCVDIFFALKPISLYESVYLEKKFKLFRIILGTQYLNFFDSIIRITKVDAKVAIRDSILLDTLVFANATNSEGKMEAIINLWKIQHTEGTTIQRDTILSINKRLTPLVKFVTSQRSIEGQAQKIFIEFLNYYYNIRQLLDDIMDYEDDLKSNTHSYATTKGLTHTRKMVKRITDKALSLELPLLYKLILLQYKKFYISIL